MPIDLTTLNNQNTYNPSWLWSKFTGNGKNNVGILSVLANIDETIKRNARLPVNNLFNIINTHMNKEGVKIETNINENTRVSAFSLRSLIEIDAVKKMLKVYAPDFLKFGNKIVIPLTTAITQIKKLDNTNERFVNTSYVDINEQYSDIIYPEDTSNRFPVGIRFNLYDAWEFISEFMQTKIVETAKTCSAPELTELLTIMSNFAYDMHVYKEIFEFAKTTFSPEEFRNLKNENLYMLLYEYMEDLKVKKPSIPAFSFINDPNFSHALNEEQKKAIYETSPYSLIQAGAGTGKSTTLFNRMQLMIENGIDAESIGVFSFTNAAANHVKAKFPAVYSSTIAAFINNLYNANFNHTLSDDLTFCDCVYMQIPPSDANYNIADSLVRHIKNFVNRGNNHDYMKLLKFIQDHETDVLTIMDKIKITTLTLQPIICYIKLTSLNIPSEYDFKHILLDEVQDTNLFEFIVILKFALEKETTLFFVGDCSQTLYEFRNASPDAINILESSGIFDTHPLNINYRSTQTILTFANAVLSDIKANQFAKISLQANDIEPIDVSNIEPWQEIGTKQQFFERYPNILHTYIKDFIDKCHAKGEQVCILAYDNNTIDVTKRIMTDSAYYQKFELNDIRTPRNYPTNVFTSFYNFFESQIPFILPGPNIAQKIITSFNLYLDNHAKKGNDFIKNWFLNNVSGLLRQVENKYMAGQLNEDSFKNLVRQILIKAQIKKNSTSSLINKTNEKEPDKGDIVLGTIHSAKGLEWDNVIIIYDGETQKQTSEEKKRLYYVALTRARKRELICVRSGIQTPMLVEIHKSMKETYNNANTASALNSRIENEYRNT